MDREVVEGGAAPAFPQHQSAFPAQSPPSQAVTQTVSRDL